jgi:hypothetical protein
VEASTLAVAVLGGLLGLGAVVLAEKLWVRWQVPRLVARRKDDVGDSAALPPAADACVVELSATGVSCRRPRGSTERVAWEELQKVEIVTTDQGPLVTDVFWVLHGTEGGCVVPQDAVGQAALLERLQALPGFRNDAVIDAMGSTENARFVAWER